MEILITNNNMRLLIFVLITISFLDIDGLTEEELDDRIENADLEKLFAEIGESVAAAEGTWLDDLGAALDQDNDDAIEKLLDEITDDEIDELLAVIEDALSVAGINTAENPAENSAEIQEDSQQD